MNGYLPLSGDSNTIIITKSLEHGGFVTLNQDTGEYSYRYGPSGPFIIRKSRFGI